MADQPQTQPQTGEVQRDLLPTTTSSNITEDKGQFMGLDGMGILIVMAVFGLTNIFTGNNFPVALIVTFIVYYIIKHYLNGKPDGFLMDLISHPMRPKLFEHRPRGKKIFIIRE